MANLIITAGCNLNCEYCFARETSKDFNPGKDKMQLSSLKGIMRFLKNSGIDELRLLGGEPSLHPQFLSIVRQGLENGFNVLVFSNGLMKEEILSEISLLQPDCIRFIINIVDPVRDPAIYSAQGKALLKLGPKAGVGYNIYSRKQDPDFLISVVEKNNLIPEIRIGLAHATTPPVNEYLHPKFYQQTGYMLEKLLYKAHEQNVRITFDCGFVPCMFSEEAYDLIKETYGLIGTRCNPVLDILPDEHVISCFPLYKMGKVKLNEFSDAGGIRKVFTEKLDSFRETGIYAHCIKCEYFLRKECTGGCRAHVINRFNKTDLVRKDLSSLNNKVKNINPILPVTEKTVKQDEQKPTEKWVIPYIDQPPEFWDEIIADHGERIQSVYFPLPGTLTGSGRPSQPDRYLPSFLENTRIRKSLIINPVVLPDKIEIVGKKILKEAEKLIQSYGITEITLANVSLAYLFRKEFPGISLTASVLMDIHEPAQLIMIDGLFDKIVPSGRILRNIKALRKIRSGFRGKIRLIVNEGCLPGCVFRTQHFYEMGSPGIGYPESLCHDLLSQKPWLRLTGAWVLPQFLSFYEDLFDELKLAGRVTLRDPEKFKYVLSGYLGRKNMMPHETGGGPASPADPIYISRDFFEHTLVCNNDCTHCSYCEDYWDKSFNHQVHEGPIIIRKKITEQTEKLEQYINQFKDNMPSGIDPDKIREEWDKLPYDYHSSERKMPSPEWKEKGFGNKGSSCRDILIEKINLHCSEHISLYIHIPFCDRKCGFCDCSSTSVPVKIKEKSGVFTKRLLSEIRFWAGNTVLPGKQISTVHFGGGTPDYLPHTYLLNIMNCIKGELKVADTTEFALESTSSLLTNRRLHELYDMGFRRLHVGVQTLNDQIRKKIGRKESAADVLERLETALRMGFIVSVDVIYGLPFQTLECLVDTLKQLILCGIHGVSLYHLNITDKNMKYFSKFSGFERDIVYDYLLFNIADQFLLLNGYNKNHFVHYAGKEDKNLYYNHVCRGEDLLALGPTADGSFHDYYYVNEQIRQYMSEKEINNKPFYSGGHFSDHEFRIRPLKARLLGANIPEQYIKDYGVTELIDRWQKQCLLRKVNNEFRLTGNGSWFINKMVEELMVNGI